MMNLRVVFLVQFMLAVVAFGYDVSPRFQQEADQPVYDVTNGFDVKDELMKEDGTQAKDDVFQSIYEPEEVEPAIDPESDVELGEDWIYPDQDQRPRLSDKTRDAMRGVMDGVATRDAMNDGNSLGRVHNTHVHIHTHTNTMKCQSGASNVRFGIYLGRQSRIKTVTIRFKSAFPTPPAVTYGTTRVDALHGVRYGIDLVLVTRFQMKFRVATWGLRTHVRSLRINWMACPQ